MMISKNLEIKKHIPPISPELKQTSRMQKRKQKDKKERPNACTLFIHHHIISTPKSSPLAFRAGVLVPSVNPLTLSTTPPTAAGSAGPPPPDWIASCSVTLGAGGAPFIS
jgi:hypothetical protein